MDNVALFFSNPIVIRKSLNGNVLSGKSRVKKMAICKSLSTIQQFYF